jgi:hypothetical protein
MDEVFPVLAGVIVGLVTQILASRRARGLALGALSVLFGALATWISGEFPISWIYLLIDIAQVLGVALLTWGLATAWRRRAWRTS